MQDRIQAIASRSDMKTFVKEHCVNLKLKNNESLDVWKAKVTKMLCQPPTEQATEPTESPQVERSPQKATKVRVRPSKSNVEPLTKGKKVKKEPKEAPPKVEKPVKVEKAKKVEKKKAEKVVKLKVEKKPTKAKGEKDAFGVVVGSLTHKFIQTVYKKPCTMKALVESGIGKHPKTLKKMVAMGYMVRDKSGLISMTAKGQKVYGGSK